MNCKWWHLLGILTTVALPLEGEHKRNNKKKKKQNQNKRMLGSLGTFSSKTAEAYLTYYLQSIGAFSIWTCLVHWSRLELNHSVWWKHNNKTLTIFIGCFCVYSKGVEWRSRFICKIRITEAKSFDLIFTNVVIFIFLFGFVSRLFFSTK